MLGSLFIETQCTLLGSYRLFAAHDENVMVVVITDFGWWINEFTTDCI